MRLLTETEQRTHFAKFILAGQLRGDTETRTGYYKTAINNGWLDIDEVRALEDMNNLPGGIGKKHFMPVNMAEITKEKFAPGPQEPAVAA